ncbi:F-box family protein-related protein [Prunus dulcis]|uniref:F-box family protein-related protein n=1 Tax=Prunus dulcis TaxID=3755 RepID=A0A4Y1RCG1_PRUDU|nr:F-box family protein-related protein [Prunus dulcis]
MAKIKECDLQWLLKSMIMATEVMTKFRKNLRTAGAGFVRLHSTTKFPVSFQRVAWRVNRNRYLVTGSNVLCHCEDSSRADAFGNLSKW